MHRCETDRWHSAIGLFSLREVKTNIPSAHDIQRMKVQLHSLFGIWSDDANTIEFKITPLVGGAKIKVWTVNNLSAIQKISMFCGLEAVPKRTHWQGFDLITHLEKKSPDSFVNGVVNMPNNRRKNIAELRISGRYNAILDFFHQEFSRGAFVQNKSGSMQLIQRLDH